MKAVGTGGRERRISASDGVRLFVREYGERRQDRPSLLCLSGLTRNSKDFADLANRVASSWHVVCPDYRGRGRSDYASDWRAYRPTVLIDDIRQLLSALGLHRVVYIGTSLGGLLACAMGVVAPVGVAGVLMNDIGPDVNEEGLSAIIDYIREDRPQPDWASAVAFMQKTFPDLPAHDDAQWQRLAYNTFREGGDGQLHYDWDVHCTRPFIDENSMIEQLWPLYRSLRHVPLAVLRGARSNVLSEATFGRMTEAIPAAICAQVPNVGHTPSLMEPESLEVIDALLDRIAPAHH